MNRLQFLSEMKKSLVKTTKEITFPLIDEKVEKIDEITDQITGVHWLQLEGVNPNFFHGVQEHFINKHFILLHSDGEHLKAYEKICSNCNSLVQWIAFEQKVKCFTCEKTYNIALDRGDLCCKRYSTKEKDGEWFIGMG